MLQSMRSQRVRHDSVTEEQQPKERIRVHRCKWSSLPMGLKPDGPRSFFLFLAKNLKRKENGYNGVEYR